MEVCKLVKYVDGKNPSDIVGNTPLHDAAIEGQEAVYKFLVDNEFDEVLSIIEELRKVEKRHFIKKFFPGILKK